MPYKHFNCLFYLLLLCLLAGCELIRDEAQLVVYNKTNQTLTDVTLKYAASRKVVYVADIKPYSTIRYKVDNHREDALTLIYIDVKGVRHEEVVIGYILTGVGEITSYVIK